MFSRIVNMEVENGRALVEVALPDWSDRPQGSYFEISLWECGIMSEGQKTEKLPSGNPPVYTCVCPMDEDDKCIINLVNPHLWQGAEKPFLYHLKVDAVISDKGQNSSEGQSTREVLFNHPIAIRRLKEIPEKGCFLNGSPFQIRGVYYKGICDIYHKISAFFWEGIMQRLQALARMGANMLVLESGQELSEQEWFILQEYCDRVGLFLQIEKGDTANIFGVKKISEPCIETDNCVSGAELYNSAGQPTDAYYKCMAKWSKIPMVYISSQSLRRQEKGGYALSVYTNCSKVVLMVNGTVFGVGEGMGEVCFEDISIKGFPVDITARAGECSMTVRSYGVHGKFS